VPSSAALSRAAAPSYFSMGEDARMKATLEVINRMQREGIFGKYEFLRGNP